MIILKFGGTSVGSAGQMKKVAEIINDGQKKIVVLSAMAGTTNFLFEIVTDLYAKRNTGAIEKIRTLEDKYYKTVSDLYSRDEFIQKGNELIKYHFDYIRSFTLDLFTLHEDKAILAQGELISSALFQFFLEEQKIDSVLLPALAFMRIDTNSEPDSYYIKENLAREIKQHPEQNIFITQGYICRNLYGEIDNLKRGGSDYSASLIGEAVNADEIQIWTDVNGFYCNDPRFVKDVKPISRLGFDEAAELAYFGAKILHPSSILPAKLAGIPVRLKNTHNPSGPGTLITNKSAGNGIKAVAAKDGITAIRIKSGRMLLAYGFIRKVFEVFERYKTPVDMITTSEVAVSVTIDDKTHFKEIVSELQNYGIVEVNEEMTIICIVGENIINQQGHISRVFELLKDFSVRMISYGGSNHNISVLVRSDEKINALNSLNKIFS
jgi:aspartate kinase